MIKITVITSTDEKSVFFSEDSFFIGDQKSDSINTKNSQFLPLTGIGLKPEHLRIFKQEGHLFVQNLANDPFVTLDNLPFYKKEAKNGSIIRIRDKDLKIELVNEEDRSRSTKELPKEPIRDFPKETLRDSLKESPKEVVQTNEIEEAHHEEEIIHAAPLLKRESTPRSSLKDLENQLEKEGTNEEEKSWLAHLNVSPFRNIRLLSFFLMTFFLVFGIIAVESYLRAGERSDKDELKAAESLSDIAMSLTYAQFYHISPQKHNWSDPIFIQNNLLATLPTGSSAGTVLNSQGEFTSCLYFLRVYTSNDLSRFLVVAHPTPSLIHWLIPKSALVVDSNSMEIRRIRNVKGLNRLLANLNTLDGLSLAQITDLVKKEEIIPLSYIAKMANKPEFQPPRVLAFLRPGAENLIYNAPRYHPFGDALLKKASEFASIHTSSHELAMLQAELEILKKYPNLILYTTKSIEEANVAINALKKIGPHKKYLLATVKYDNMGQFRSSKIIMDHNDVEKAEELALKESTQKEVTEKVIEAPFVTKAAIFSIPSQSTDEILTWGTLPETTLPLDKQTEEVIAQVEENSKEKEDLILLKLTEIKEKQKNEKAKHKKIAYDAVDAYFENSKKKPLLEKLEDVAALLKEDDEIAKESLFELSFQNDKNLEDLLKHLNTIENNDPNLR